MKNAASGFQSWPEDDHNRFCFGKLLLSRLYFSSGEFQIYFSLDLL